MQVEIKLDNLEMIRAIKDGSLEALMKSIENEIDILKQEEKKPTKAKPAAKVEKIESTNEVVAEKKEPVKEDKQAEEKEYTLDEVRAMFAAKNKPAQRSKLKALLKKYNATNISGLDTKDYASVVEDLGEI